MIQRYNYSAYGRTKVEKTNPSAKIVKNPYAYTSREWEEETGDYFYRARYYNPNTGRFLSEDPIVFGGGVVNAFSYARNNPVSFIDEEGKSPTVPQEMVGEKLHELGMHLNEMYTFKEYRQMSPKYFYDQEQRSKFLKYLEKQNEDYNKEATKKYRQEYDPINPKRSCDL